MILPAGSLDDAERGGEAEAGALALPLRAEERLEEVPDDLLGHPGPVVLHGELHPGGCRGGAGSFLRHPACLHADPATPGHRVPGVDDEVQDHLLELRGRDRDLPEPAVLEEVHLHAAPEDAGDVPGHLGEDPPHVAAGGRLRLAAGHGQDLPGERRAAIGRGGHVGQVGVRRMAVRQRLARQRGAGADDREQVAEVVGHPCRELPDGLELLGVAHPLGALQRFGDVASAHGQDPGCRSPRPRRRRRRRPELARAPWRPGRCPARSLPPGPARGGPRSAGRSASSTASTKRSPRRAPERAPRARSADGLAQATWPPPSTRKRRSEMQEETLRIAGAPARTGGALGRQRGMWPAPGTPDGPGEEGRPRPRARRSSGRGAW